MSATIEAATPNPRPSRSGLPPTQRIADAHTADASGVDLAARQDVSDIQTRNAGGVVLDPDHGMNDAQRDVVEVDLPADQRGSDTHVSGVGGELSGDHPRTDNQTNSVTAELAFNAAFLDDIENVRKATANRLGAMNREGVGGTQYQPQLDALEALEHQAILALQRSMRKHPLGPWVKRTVGIGEKQAARLIAAIGDITWNTLDDRPRRGPAELWAYCGYRPDQKRRKGIQSNWNADAKMRAHLIAESCIKQAHSPYRAVYDQARASWADRDTSDGHKHNHALRVVAKAVLRDMWRESHRLSGGQTRHDIQRLRASAELGPDFRAGDAHTPTVGASLVGTSA